MTILREAAQQALEALEAMQSYAAAERKGLRICDEAIPTLRAALAQQAEPVQDQRCRAEPRSDGDFVCDCKIGECPGRSAALAQQAEPVEQLAELQAMLRAEVDRLIAAGIQPQRKLVPLTEEEIMHIGMTHQSLRQVVRAVERAHGIKE